MRKPRLTAPVFRGLEAAIHEMCAGDLDGMKESGIIGSVADVLRAREWVLEMRDYRQWLAARSTSEGGDDA